MAFILSRYACGKAADEDADEYMVSISIGSDCYEGIVSISKENVELKISQPEWLNYLSVIWIGDKYTVYVAGVAVEQKKLPIDDDILNHTVGIIRSLGDGKTTLEQTVNIKGYSVGIKIKQTKGNS